MIIEIDDARTVSGLPIPDGWVCEETKRDDGGVFGRVWRRVFGEAITVVESMSRKSDGRVWLHVSVAKPGGKKLPTWEDLGVLKNTFIGEEREAYMIFPPKSRYVNIYQVLHLYCCLDSPDGVLPQMEGEVLGVKSI